MKQSFEISWEHLFIFYQTFGLIETNWEGTIVEAWSTPEGLNSCDIAPNDDNPPNANSYLFNAMINPLLKNAIYGALWYQGKYSWK